MTNGVDIETIRMELQLADLSQLEKQKEKLASKSRSSNAPQLRATLDIVNRCIEQLNQDKSPASIEWEKEELPIFRSLQLLTAIPPLYILNTDSESAAKGNKYTEEVKKYIGEQNCLVLSAQLEQESILFGDSASQLEYLEQFGIHESALNSVVSACSKLLGLCTFYTVGKNEARAWHTEKGSTVQEAGGRIHSDFVSKFIKAEVMHYNDYVSLKGEENCRKAGKWFVEGPSYICQDGDILFYHIRKLSVCFPNEITMITSSGSFSSIFMIIIDDGTVRICLIIIE